MGALVLHGFTGSPHSMRPLAQALAEAGCTVEAPLLPGHGTAVEDLVPLRWDDWYAAVAAAYDDLAGRTERVVVAGLSMGGTLAATLAADKDPAGLVAINASIVPPADSFIELAHNVVKSGFPTFPGIGNDVAKPGVDEYGYGETPVAAAISLFAANAAIAGRLHEITCPVLVFTSRVDHVVPQESSEALVNGVAGPVEQVWLERSYHVATLDFDADVIESGTVDFVRKVTAG